MNDSQPLYRSRPSWRSLGNTYLIFTDRLELHCGWFFLRKKWVIEKEEIISIDTYPPPVIRTAVWALKLDWADLFNHVGVQRKQGVIKQLRFTPDDPDAFVAKVKEAFSRKSSEST